jgi:hypothetical protein
VSANGFPKATGRSKDESLKYNEEPVDLRKSAYLMDLKNRHIEIQAKNHWNYMGIKFYQIPMTAGIAVYWRGGRMLLVVRNAR